MSSVPPPEDHVPYIPPPPEAPSREVLPIRPQDLWHWLLEGGRDMQAYPGISLFYGVAFWAMAAVLGLVFRSSPQYTMSMASGCLLVGPFLAMGLYDVSRRRTKGLVPTLGESLTCWSTHVRSMAMLVLVLMVLELLWGRASLVVFAVFFNTGMPSSTGVVQAIFNPDNWEFVLAYALVGGVFAMLVFSVGVVSIPMILDRDTDAISAAITSLEVVLRNTPVMLLWGAVITALVAGALLLPWGGGLLIAGPLLGHASWYAYKGSVRWLDGEASDSPV